MILRINILGVLCALALINPLSMMGQDKQFTLHDLIPGGKTQSRFVPRNLKQLQWCGDTYLYVKGDSMMSGESTKAVKVAFTRLQLNEALAVAGAQSVGGMPFFSVPYKDQPVLAFNAKHHRFHYDFVENRIVSMYDLNGSWENLDFCPANGYLAFTEEDNLKILSPDNAVSIVTDETAEGVVCGKSVHQNEFGIHKGTFWSPNGSALAFYRMDESMVTQYPLVDITARVGEVNNVRYPMAGMLSHQVTVGIYNPDTQKTVYLNTGDPTNRYFTNISWAPDGKSLYLIELNRDQNHAKLCRYNSETGELMSTLIEETHSKYVEPQQPILFLPWDHTQFIYQSQKDGYNHLYLYNTDGKLIKQLTKGDWLVQDVLGFNAKKKEVIIASTELSPLQSNLYKVNVNTNKRTPLDNSEGVHNGILSASGNYIIDRYSTPDTPRQIEIVNTQNRKSISLLTAKNPYEGFTMPAIETGTIKAADGKTDLYYRLVKPADFDPNKKYPAIVYVYGGPHAQMITNGWMNGARGWDIYMANKGYIMFTLDNRGSDNRGLEFENVTFRHLGIEEGKDQVKGVEFLKSLPYVDGNRIGVHGWSFGGHMTTALMLRYPEIFKVGVAGGPVIDWGYYEIMYGERYMDTPQSNPEGYEQCNLKNLAGNLKGHLLLIHDDHDDTCVPQHTLSFIKACVDARTYPDLFIYPTHKHNVIGRDRVHLHEKITRYFEDNL